MFFQSRLIFAVSLLIIAAEMRAEANPKPELNAAQMQVIQSCSQSSGVAPGTPPHQLSAEKRALMRSCIQKSGVSIPPPAAPPGFRRPPPRSGGTLPLSR
ncbi:MAG: hypothetical protein KGQ59_11360 [Bdellovibrionales bacterium]|nr:hypothetical protein [Bdellovibrionales bacterium]